MMWYDDSVQGLLEEILKAINDIVNSSEDYEQAEVRQGRPQFRDTDLPLNKPIITVEPVTVNQYPVAFNDQLASERLGMAVNGLFTVNVWTSRGTPGTPRSGSGGLATANRLIGLLMNDINITTDFMPDSIVAWNLSEAPAGADWRLAEYDESHDLYNAQGFLYVESEAWKRNA